jgi:hypothetical protein
MPPITPATRRANFAIGDEQTARRVVDLLNESFFEGQAAITAFAGSDGRWGITLHFADPPDEIQSAPWWGWPPAMPWRKASYSTPSKPRTG